MLIHMYVLFLKDLYAHAGADLRGIGGSSPLLPKSSIKMKTRKMRIKKRGKKMKKKRRNVSGDEEEDTRTHLCHNA